MGLLDFLKKSNKYDADGFDADGYNRLGYDRMGYDKDGYDINGYNREGYNAKGIYKLTGRDAEGYDEEGFNVQGIDRNGFDRNGYDKDGYNKDGYSKEGYDRSGYNRAGYNRRGLDKDGYNEQGYGKDGYNRAGYNKKGFNRAGYDKDGYDKDGFNIDGINRQGYDVYGFGRDGYNVQGYDRDGYDRDGYNKKGYNKDGYNRDGFDKHGYDREGYNVEGFDKSGYNREGYDEEGYNRDGIDREGYNREGYNSDGYDREGYDRKGFNKDSFSKLGFHKKDFDENGYHKITGLDVYGYSKFGYNINGINKHTGRDRLGFDADGIDEAGLNIWGFNVEKQMDRFGNAVSIYDDDPKMSTEMCEAFEKLYYQYMAGKNTIAVKLANCYCYGKGTVKDFKKALRILVDAAFEYQDLGAIRDLADHFYIGDIIGENIALSNYLNDIVDNKKIQTINQYRARQALEFPEQINTGDKTYKEEEAHLERVMKSIDNKITQCESQMEDIDNDTSWMDFDQLQDWRLRKARNIEARKKIEEYEQIRCRPYYARMDAKTSRGKETFYIGEIGYSDYGDTTCNVLSVWSDVGSNYRNSSKKTFSINGYKYNVLLRRKIDIVRGCLAGYYDEYKEGSDAAKADITNPYLLRILEQKRGEKNITNIIRSIQLNQNEIIDTDFKANILIQGCAGSGKTMILLHRLANMKYNQKNYDWSKVKIITPNKDFTLFIDELSKNLKIDEIEKLTLQEYYLHILAKYDEQHAEKITKDSEVLFVSHFNYKNELKKVKDESELDIEIRKLIYSIEFRERIKKEALERKEKIDNYQDANTQFVDVFFSVMEDWGCKVPKRMPNYICFLYSKVLFMYFVFGNIRSNENMLCIDEGQDICDMQYILLYEVNGKKTCLNVYGDLAQRIPNNVNLSSWETLRKMLDATYFELNENYRNSENIIKYYGKKLGIKNGSFGVKTKAVEQFLYDELDILLKLQLMLGNRVVVISNSEKAVPQSVLSLCKEGGIAENHISVMDVKQVKGLEFDTAFVFDEGMDNNEKYIAYTRALSELYVSSKVVGQQKRALNIKGEISDSNDVNNAKNQGKYRGIEEDEDNESPTEEYTSITKLNDKNKQELLIVVRESWSNDFCFVVEKFDGQMARGSQYLNGKFHKSSSYNKFWNEFAIYNGPSRKKIEKQYK